MTDYRDVLRNISKLESMVPGIIDFGKPNWKATWNQIRITGKSFKGVRFPKKEEHEAAWEKFQDIVSSVKSHQEADQKRWQVKKEESERIRNSIISQAQAAEPYDSGLADVILTIATGGANLLLNAIMGPFDEEKQMLKNCGNQLQKGWDILNQNKNKMFGKDKQIAFEKLNYTKEMIDRRWTSYKNQRQTAWEKFQSEREAKRRAWENRVESNTRSLEERREKLNRVLSHKENHLNELYDKLNDARSDEFRSRVSGWISEEESSIRDIKEKLDNIEDWIYENKQKLQ